MDQVTAACKIMLNFNLDGLCHADVIIMVYVMGPLFRWKLSEKTHSLCAAFDNKLSSPRDYDMVSNGEKK